MQLLFALYKPFGYLSQFKTDAKRKKLLGELYPFPEGTMAIGRLDEESEGLLLLTTDGRISEDVRSSGIEKEYYVQVDGQITDEAIEKLSTGVSVTIEGTPYITMPCKVQRLESIPEFPPRSRPVRSDRHGPTSWISITLREGRNRQIRKMTAAVGFPTLRLVRIRIGEITIGNLQPGEVKVIPNHPLSL